MLDKPRKHKPKPLVRGLNLKMNQVAVLVLKLMKMQTPLISFVEVVPHCSDGVLFWMF
jgi:hypothetical protein